MDDGREEESTGGVGDSELPDRGAISSGIWFVLICRQTLTPL